MKIITSGTKRNRRIAADQRWFVGSIPNPPYDLTKDGATGKDMAVQNWIICQPEAQRLVKEIRRYAIEHPESTLWLECIGGRHRSVAVAEIVADYLSAFGIDAEVQHLELEVAQPK